MVCCFSKKIGLWLKLLLVEIDSRTVRQLRGAEAFLNVFLEEGWKSKGSGREQPEPQDK